MTVLEKNISAGNRQVKKADQWIHSLSEREHAPVKLICFPFAGGGTTIYQPWVPLLSSTIDVSAVLLPGREIRIQKAPEGDVNTVCGAIVNEIMRTYSHGAPLVFFGHSMGAILAYEVAKRLQEHHNRLPSAVIISGRQSARFFALSEFHKASDNQLIAELRRFGRIPDAVLEDKEMRNLILPMLRADYTLLETYRLADPAPLNCPLVTCTGQDDTEVTPEQIQQWQLLFSGKTEHRVFAGDHFYLLDTVIQMQLLRFINGYISHL